jgi:cytochrome c oxidase subunit II
VESSPLLFRALYMDPHGTSIFTTFSTPGNEIRGLSFFVLAITGGIFLVVSALLIHVLVRYRARPDDDSEPPQVFGSLQIELSWTIIPILIIVVLFLSTARVLFSVQDAPKPKTALDVVVIGHQFWWEFRYPQFGVVTANELHLPLSTREAPRPAFIKLTSADVMHSFWIPELSGKTDVLPNRVNEMWIDPQSLGLFRGQCAQFCGPEHARMLLRVYVDTPEKFQQWIANQQRSQPELNGNQAGFGNENSASGAVRPVAAISSDPNKVAGNTSGNQNEAKYGQFVFEHQACINCHTVSGTVASGRYGPDLTHLMSRETLAAGAAENNPQNLEKWIADPDNFKPGSLMPAMHLSDRDNAAIAAYLETLK